MHSNVLLHCAALDGWSLHRTLLYQLQWSRLDLLYRHARGEGRDFGPSGFGRFTHDPQTQIVAGLTWDFGHGYAGGLAVPETDASLGSILLDAAAQGIAQRRELFGFFDYAQFDRVPFFPLRQQTAYHFALERGGLFPHDGAFKARERNPQTFPVYFDRFDDPARVEQLWDVHSGEWTDDGDAYQSRAALPTALTTLKVYETSHLSTLPSSVLDDAQPYAVTARLMNRGASAQSSIGLVYNYRDASSFNEVTFSPAGAVQLREIRSGTARTIAADGTKAVRNCGSTSSCDVAMVAPA